MLKLFNYFRSSASYRVRIALNLKGLEYKEMPIHLLNNGGEQHSKEYRALNPQGLVPVLQDGNKIITQSLAIIEYLDELYPTPPLLPADPFTKSLVKAFALTIAAEIHALNNLRVIKYLTNDMQLSDGQKDTWYAHWIAQGFSALEAQLAQQGTQGNYCFSNQLTIADIFLVPQMLNARRYHCDLSAYPRLVRIDAHCQTLPAFFSARPIEATA